MMKRLSILCINNYSYLRGGSERYFINLNHLLDIHNHNISICSTYDSRNVDPHYPFIFIKPVDLLNPSFLNLFRFIYSLYASSKIKIFLKEIRPDIAHLHIYYGHFTSSILRTIKNIDIPIVQTLHDYKIVCPVFTLVSHGELCQACHGSDFWHAMIKRCNRGSWARSTLSAVESYVSRAMGAMRHIDHFIAVSDFQRNKLIELGIPAEKITRIYNFLDTSGIPVNKEQGKYFLYFGRLERVKGLFTLLQAASTLTSVPLLIAGEGEARHELEGLIERHGLRHVRLVGFQRGDELSHLIHNSICTVAPSEWYETFGFALVESFAHGRPVIASRIGGMTEIVSEGIDGFLFPPGDVGALRDRMLWMAEHRHAAVEMGLAGRRKVETQFHPESHYEQLMNVYQKVL